MSGGRSQGGSQLLNNSRSLSGSHPMNNSRSPGGGKISPSIMCANFLNLAGDLKIMEAYGVDYLHVDVMDGIFVPNYTLGTDFIKKLKCASEIPLDIHLMIDSPENKIDWFYFGEGDIVSFHYEASDDVQGAIQKIRGRGATAMLALNPATPLGVLDEIAPDLEAVLIMTVNPGFAGQKLVARTLYKISRLRQTYPGIIIEADGNVSFENAIKMREAGADIFVAGSSSIFSKEGGLGENIIKLRSCIA
jgi:ribulose-phosphate 3-epimerase